MNKHVFLGIATLAAFMLVALPLADVHAQASLVRIDSLSPHPLIPGENFTIHGAGFTPSGNIATLDGPYEKKFFLSSPDGVSLSFKLPSYITPGPYQLTVRNKDGQQATTTVTVGEKPSPTAGPTPTPNFTPNPTGTPTPTRPPGGSPAPTTSPAPTQGPHITGFSPNPVAVNQIVTITGSGFTPNNNLVHLIGATDERKYFITSPSGTQLSVRLSRFLDPGTYTVTVRNGHYQTSNALSLTVTAEAEDDNDCFLIIFCGPDDEDEDDDKGQDQYVALGDSIAAGTGAFQGYVPRYRRFIEDFLSRSVDLDNRSRLGWGSAELANALRSDASFREAVREAEFITWNIGGNDLRAAREQYRRGTCGGADNQNCLRNAVAEFRQNWNVIVREIGSLRQGQAAVRTMTMYNPYVFEDKIEDSWPNDEGNDFRNLRPYWEAVNDHIENTSGQHGIKVAPVHVFFNGPNGNEDPEERNLMSFDGFHPNDAGHAAIAGALRTLGFAGANPGPVPAPTPSFAPFPQPTIMPLPTITPPSKPPFTFTPPNPLPTIAPRS